MNTTKRNPNLLDLHAALKSVLLEDFESRKRTNPRYSLRAFAKRIGSSHSYLLRIFDGGRKLSYKTFLEFAYKGQISQDKFRPIIEHFNAISPKEQFIIPMTLSEYKFISTHKVVVITSIIQILTPLYDLSLFSKLTGLTKTDVDTIIKKGILLGFYTVDSENRLQKRPGTLGMPTDNVLEMKKIRNENIIKSVKNVLTYLTKTLTHDSDPVNSYHTQISFPLRKGEFKSAFGKKLRQEEWLFLKKTFTDNTKTSPKRQSKQPMAYYTWNLNIIPEWEE